MQQRASRSALTKQKKKMYKLEVKALYIIQLEEEKHVRMKKS